MKTCTTCKKETDNFSPNKRMQDGLHSRCRDCSNAISTERSRTKDGLVTKIYSAQRSLSRRRGYALPDYTRKDLQDWMLSQPNFESLYQAWVDSDYDTNLIPSCDRLDDYAPYMLSNIQLMTWSENRLKMKVDQKEWRNNKNSKAVLQFKKGGDLIAEYYSISEASRQVGLCPIHISRVCQGKHPTAGGYYWKFKLNLE